MEFRQVIEEYLEVNCKTKKERETVRNLLEKRVLEQFRREVGEVTLEDVLSSEWIRNQLYECFQDVLSLETRSKEKSAERLKKFGKYLKKHYQLDLDLDKRLPQFLDESIPRQVDLLKTLHTTSRIEDLREHYNLSPKPLRAELEALECGQEILGQNVKIERVVTPRGEIKFASTVHPVFLALNLTEVNVLTVALKQLGKGTLMEEAYNHLADTIYSQLSSYGKGKIDQVAQPLGITFHQQKVRRGYRLEEEMIKRSTYDTLLYAWKSGERTRIIYKVENMEQEILGYVVKCEMKTGEVFIQQERGKGDVFSLKQEDIVAAWKM